VECCVEVAGAPIRVEIDRQEGSAHDAECMSLPVGHNIGLGLVIRYQLDVYFKLSIDIALVVKGQSTLEKAHLIDA
jgi:hypothetical protein